MRGLGVQCCGHVVSVRWAVIWFCRARILFVGSGPVWGPFGDGLFGTVVAYRTDST